MSVKLKVFLMLALVVLVVWGVLRLLAWGQCSWYGYQTSRDVRYAAFVGCMVQVGDHWVPRTELRTEQ
jgi:hypothetical protein